MIEESSICNEMHVQIFKVTENMVVIIYSYDADKFALCLLSDN